MKGIVKSRHRVRIPEEQRLPLNVRSAGHAVVEPGWRHAAGIVDRYNFYWGVTGETNYTVDDRLYTTRPEEVLVFPLNSQMGGAEQHVHAEYRWFTMDGAVAEPLFKDLGLEFFVPFHAGKCPAKLHENLLHSFDDVTPVAAMNSELIVYEILTGIKLNRELNCKKDEIRRCREIIDAGFTESSLDVSTVAEETGIDRTVMARQFKAVNGMSPSKYLQSKRLMLALRYLESGCTTVETAGHCGFNDAGYFARSFKRHFGLTPQSWRDSMSNRV